MISVDIDQQEVKELVLEKVEEAVKNYNAEMVFWDANELKRRTCMSWNTMQKNFFYHPDFPKYKVGSKWYFPAEKTKEFLISWLEEQKRY